MLCAEGLSVFLRAGWPIWIFTHVLTSMLSFRFLTLFWNPFNFSSWWNL